MTGHKSLTHAFCGNNSCYSAREIRHLAFISEFTTDLCYIKRVDNVAADAVSPGEGRFFFATRSRRSFDGSASKRGGATGNADYSIIEVHCCALPFCSGSLLCENSAEMPRPFVPASLRKAVLRASHEIDHRDIRPTQRRVTARFV